jgi:hypothetical protein
MIMYDDSGWGLYTFVYILFYYQRKERPNQIGQSAPSPRLHIHGLYRRSFVAADVDLDGKVSVEEFDGMIEAAAALPR